MLCQPYNKYMAITMILPDFSFNDVLGVDGESKMM